MMDFFKKELLNENAGLKKRIRELENIVASIAAPMIVVDKNLMITSANDSALKKMGYRHDRRDEVVGKMTCADFQKTLLCGTANCTLKNCMRTGENVFGETVAHTRDGKKFPFRPRARRSWTRKGRPMAVLRSLSTGLTKSMPSGK